MNRLTRDGAAEPVSRDQILRRERGQGNINFPCPADPEQDRGNLTRLIHPLAICVTIHSWAFANPMARFGTELYGAHTCTRKKSKKPPQAYNTRFCRSIWCAGFSLGRRQSGLRCWPLTCPASLRNRSSWSGRERITSTSM